MLPPDRRPPHSSPVQAQEGGEQGARQQAARQPCQPGGRASQGAAAQRGQTSQRRTLILALCKT